MFEKKITLEGAELTVEIMLFKSTGSKKEMDRVTVVRKALGDFLPAYVPP